MVVEKQFPFTKDGKDYQLRVEFRFQDLDQDGSKTFIIRADIYDGNFLVTEGVSHATIFEHAPQLGPLFQWNCVKTKDNPPKEFWRDLHLLGFKL